MNYQLYYDRIINNAWKREEPEASNREIHHVIPKSLGGSDEPSNLVALTLREHCVAHKLLAKIYLDSQEMKRAFNFMCRFSSHVYASKRRAVYHQLLGRYVSSSTCSAISESRRYSSPPILQIDIETQEILAVFRSAIDAAESINSNMNRQNDLITNCAIRNQTGGAHTSAGYIWKYK